MAGELDFGFFLPYNFGDFENAPGKAGQIGTKLAARSSPAWMDRELFFVFLLQTAVDEEVFPVPEKTNDTISRKGALFQTSHPDVP